MNERVFSPSQAHRLDAPERRTWLPLSEVLQILDLHPGMTVADIGAGTGYFSLPIASSIGEQGKVYAVDLQPEMLACIREKLIGTAIMNIECRAGAASATGLTDGSCDLILMAYIWHELENISDVLSEANRILRIKGRIAVLDWRPGVQQPPGPPLDHRIPQKDTVKGLIGAGFQMSCISEIGPFAYLIVAVSGEDRA
ncbi:MAG TPA: methyltransferase domain-containing protein [Acidobacteriaceae bacterium]